MAENANIEILKIIIHKKLFIIKLLKKLNI
jgi:hypothetical protein